MRISKSQLEAEIVSLLELMKQGAELWFSSKLSGQYHLELPNQKPMKVARRAARAAWEQGWINADQHNNGFTRYVLTQEGWIHCLPETKVPVAAPQHPDNSGHDAHAAELLSNNWNRW